MVRNPTEVHSRTLSNQGSEISPFGLLGYNARGDFLGSRNTTETDPSGNRHSWTGGNLPDVFLPSNGLEEVRACDDCKVVTTREDEESLSGGNMRGIYRSWEGPPSNLPGRRQSGLETWSSSPVDMGASTAAAYGNGDGNGRRRRQSVSDRTLISQHLCYNNIRPTNYY